MPLSVAQVCSLGDTPYPQYQAFTNAFTAFLKKGHRMPKDANWPSFAYAVMCKCWDVKPATRPTFEGLVRIFSASGKRSKPPNGGCS